MNRVGERGPTGDHGQKGDKGDVGPARIESIHLYRWRALAIWIVAVSVLLVWDHHRTDHAIDQNRALIKQEERNTRIHNQEVQLSRQHSCEQTYLTIRAIFLPFVKPKKIRTAKEQNQLERFLFLTRPAKCRVQTDPKTVEKKGG